MSAVFEPESRAVDRTQIFENASIVLPAAVTTGWIAVSGERIVELGEGRAPERGLDCAGDFLVAGLIDLHTDHLENHLQPRPKVAWPPLAAVVAYDAQVAASAITTVFDCVRVGSDLAYGSVAAELKAILGAIEAARAQDLLRAEHRLHVRCEICAEDVVEQTGWLLKGYDTKLISLMDHTPGARQFCDLGAWKTYYGGKSGCPPANWSASCTPGALSLPPTMRATAPRSSPSPRRTGSSRQAMTMQRSPMLRRRSPKARRLLNSRPRPKPPRLAIAPALRC
jgi:alpha-D-ribose 1-methylphosphonate 5-triphosphate diphosphatase PhnM